MIREWISVFCVFFLALALGCASRAPSAFQEYDQANSHLAGEEQPATAPADNYIRVRIATAADLEPVLVERPNPNDHFPICTLRVYNKSAEPLVVGYTPNCVTVHCGPFEQQGPGVTFVHRREILEPQNALELQIPPGNWTMTNGEIMVPTTLPAGPYETWAMFKVESASPTQITSKHTTFTAP